MPGTRRFRGWQDDYSADGPSCRLTTNHIRRQSGGHDETVARVVHKSVDDVPRVRDDSDLRMDHGVLSADRAHREAVDVEPLACARGDDLARLDADIRGLSQESLGGYFRGPDDGTGQRGGMPEHRALFQVIWVLMVMIAQSVR